MRFLGHRLVSTRRLHRLQQRCRAYETMLAVHVRELTEQTDRPASVCGVVFSCDRALQLEALLRSYQDHVVNPAPLHVLYRARTREHAAAYAEVFEMHAAVLASTHAERNFRTDLFALLSSVGTARIFFLVDDLLFVRSVNLRWFQRYSPAATVVSLRLGSHLEYCYTHDRPQRLPVFESLGEGGLLRWRWGDGELDWGYPLSLDGHFFSRAEFLAMAEALDFCAPNSLETALQQFCSVFLPRFGVCTADAPLVNLPFNRVQTEYANRAGRIHQDWLLTQWQSGKCLDCRAYYGLRNHAVHEEQPLRLVAKTATAGPSAD